MYMYMYTVYAISVKKWRLRCWGREREETLKYETKFVIERLKALHLTLESVLQLVDEGGYHMMSHDITTHDVVYTCTCSNVHIHVCVSECTIIGRVGVSPLSHSMRLYILYIHVHVHVHTPCM